MKTAIIGGGASGFFAAINTKENFPSSEVSIFEKSSKLLSKVLVSGGGRCNVTNSERSISNFSKSYPRGEKQLKKLFGTKDQKLISAFNKTTGETRTQSKELYSCCWKIEISTCRIIFKL